MFCVARLVLDTPSFFIHMAISFVPSFTDLVALGPIDLHSQFIFLSGLSWK